MHCSRARSMVAILALLLGFAGCGGGSGPVAPGSTRAPSPGVSTAVDPPPDGVPRVPALPKSAREASERGARAFLRYYWELVNYAQQTGDVSALKRVSAPRCTGCASGIAGVARLYRKGGHATGGDYAVSIKEIHRFTSDAFYGFEALVAVRNDEQRVVRGNGSATTYAPSTSTIAVAALWIDEGWRLDVMEVR